MKALRPKSFSLRDPKLCENHIEKIRALSTGVFRQMSKQNLTALGKTIPVLENKAISILGKATPVWE